VRQRVAGEGDRGDGATVAVVAHEVSGLVALGDVPAEQLAVEGARGAGFRRGRLGPAEPAGSRWRDGLVGLPQPDDGPAGVERDEQAAAGEVVLGAVEHVAAQLHEVLRGRVDVVDGQVERPDGRRRGTG